MTLERLLAVLLELALLACVREHLVIQALSQHAATIGVQRDGRHGVHGRVCNILDLQQASAQGQAGPASVASVLRHDSLDHDEVYGWCGAGR